MTRADPSAASAASSAEVPAQAAGEVPGSASVMPPVDGVCAMPRVLATLAAGIEAGRHMGAQVYVRCGDAVLVDCAVGFTGPWEDGSGDRALRRDDLMNWLSCTKPVTAVALALLWETGRVRLDDPVAKFLPAFAAHGKAQVTLRHVLTHTGGFRFVELGWPDSAGDELIARVCAAPLEEDWTPGGHAGYHEATGWFVLGAVIERVTGAPFSQYVRQAVLEPLGMGDCWIGMPAAQWEKERGRIVPTWRVAGSVPSPDRETAIGGRAFKAVAHRWHERAWVCPAAPGGNGRGPIRELARFYAMLVDGMDGPAGTLAGVRLLRPQTVEALVARHRVGMPDRTFRRKMDWGLGFILDAKHYGQDAEHVGAANVAPYGFGPHASWRSFGHGGYQSSVSFADPDRPLVVAWSCNATPGEPAHQKRNWMLNTAIYEDLAAGTANRA